MPPYDVFDPRCPSRTVFDHVTSRWGSLVMAALARGPQRFGELTQVVGGISDRMLSATLKDLAADGLVRRDEVGPQHVAYALTEPGRAVAAATAALAAAVQDAMPAVTGA